jgi:hypothetical protein
VNLDQSDTTIVHQVYGKAKREFFLIQSKLEERKRVLTVRSQHIAVNETKVPYRMRIYWVDKVNKKVNILQEANLEPNGMSALPDNGDAELQEKIKIVVRPSFSTKWSDEFNLP